MKRTETPLDLDNILWERTLFHACNILFHYVVHSSLTDTIMHEKKMAMLYRHIDRDSSDRVFGRELSNL